MIPAQACIDGYPSLFVRSRCSLLADGIRFYSSPGLRIDLEPFDNSLPEAATILHFSVADDVDKGMLLGEQHHVPEEAACS